MEQNDTMTPQETPVEQSQVSTETTQYQSELKAFDTYVQTNQVAVPSNFKSSADWFKSLKNAQAEYTKARQELAQYKKQPAAPVVEETTEEVALEQTEPVPQIQEELRIPKAEPPKEQPPQTAQADLTQEEWKKYSVEVATTGELSQESRLAIKQKTKLPDFLIDEFMQGQKARLNAAYGEAAKVIGGKDNLARVFNWASKNLSPEQQAEINATLASPSWEVALLGLKAKYDSATAKKPTAKEPVNKVGEKVPVAKAQAATGPYLSKAEFYKDRSSPQFKNDPRFRQTVEARMMKTDFNRLT